MFLDLQYIRTIELIKSAAKIATEDRERKLQARRAKDKQNDFERLEQLTKESDE